MKSERAKDSCGKKHEGESLRDGVVKSERANDVRAGNQVTNKLKKKMKATGGKMKGNATIYAPSFLLIAPAEQLVTMVKEQLRHQEDDLVRSNKAFRNDVGSKNKDSRWQTKACSPDILDTFCT